MKSESGSLFTLAAWFDRRFILRTRGSARMVAAPIEIRSSNERPRASASQT